jgi:hypothetical protein
MNIKSSSMDEKESGGILHEKQAEMYYSGLFDAFKALF